MSKLTTRQFAISNFESDNPKAPGQVPWLKVDQAWLKDKANKDFRGLYRGLCPHVVLAILADPDGFRQLAQQSINQAAPQVAKPAPPPPPAASGPTYWAHTNGKQLEQPVDRATAIQLAMADTSALFYLVVGGDGWKSAKELGLQLPPPPAAKPMLPPPVNVVASHPVNEQPVDDEELGAVENDDDSEGEDDAESAAPPSGISNMAAQILAQRKMATAK